MNAIFELELADLRGRVRLLQSDLSEARRERDDAFIRCSSLLKEKEELGASLSKTNEKSTWFSAVVESHLEMWEIPILDKLADFPEALPQPPIKGVEMSAQTGGGEFGARSPRSGCSSVSVHTDLKRCETGGRGRWKSFSRESNTSWRSGWRVSGSVSLGVCRTPR